MRTLGLLLALLGTPFLANAQQQTDAPEGTLIESAEVSGFPIDQLSPGLRQDINALTGDRLNRERVAVLAARIEGEHPEVIAAVRNVSRPDGQVRVVFLVARISDDQNLALNINARYTIERVEIAGFPETEISQTLRDELQALVGGRLDPDEAKRLDDRLASEAPGWSVKRRISRGSQPGQIRVVFELSPVVESAPAWIPFAPSRSKFVYHSDQGWSGVLDIPIGGPGRKGAPSIPMVGPSNSRFTLGVVLGNDDDQIGEYTGFRFRVENHDVGTERLGVSIELSRFHQTWRTETLAAAASDPSIPELYRARLSVEPLATLALTRHLRLAGGVSISKLESLSRAPESQMASAAVASLGFDQRWKDSSGSSQNVAGSYELRAGTSALESSLVYQRQLGQVRYQYERGSRAVTAAVSLGRLTGAAPLFEKFSLGDSSTLRGWNKFDIAPAGSDRMFYQSLEYSEHHIAFFVDAGSVWEPDTPRRMRVSTGIGYHGENAFLTVGVPLNTSDLRVVFTMGVRF